MFSRRKSRQVRDAPYTGVSGIVSYIVILTGTVAV